MAYAAMFTDCYSNEKKVGVLRVSNSFHQWLTNGLGAEVLFFDYLNNEVLNKEISLKIGDKAWTISSLLTNDLGAYWYNFAYGITGSRCGYVWASARWRSTQDGQIHYCNLKVPNLDDSGYPVSNFINRSCISSVCRYTGNSLAAAAYIYGYNPNNPSDNTAISFVRPEGKNCQTDYTFYLNGVPARGDKGFTTRYGSAIECVLTWDEELTSTRGVVEAYVSPQPPNGFTAAQARLHMYNYINDNVCGSPESNITPTPTITPPSGGSSKNICSKVTGYVKNKITGKGIKGAKVTAHGIDNSVGNCLGKHYGCSTVTTNSAGYFEISCANVADINTKCLGVYETNKVGFTDAYGVYGPTGSTAWNNNTIMYNNPQINTCGNFYFFDKN